MDIQTRKLKLIQKFLSIKDESLLLRFEELLKVVQIESEQILKPFTIDELNRRIDESENDFKNGRYKSTTDILKRFDP